MAESEVPSKTIKSDKKGFEAKCKTENDEESSSESCVSAQEEDEDLKQIGKGVSTAAIAVNRDEYLQAHRDLTFDRGQLQMKNTILHRKLAEYYKKRKLEYALKPITISMDLEENYEQKLFLYEELKKNAERDIVDIRSKVQVVNLQYKKRLNHTEAKFGALQSLEKSTGSGLIYYKKGKPMNEKTVSKFLSLQRHKQAQSTSLCLSYIRIRNAVAELNVILKSLEMLGPGLYVDHFQQLQSEHQIFINKIEERDDELLKNRSKYTECNQILAHIREKMNHTNNVIDIAECDLGDAEFDFIMAREELGSVKGFRDNLRLSLFSQRRDAGLLTREDLLRDYQDAIDEKQSMVNNPPLLLHTLKVLETQDLEKKYKSQLYRAKMAERIMVQIFFNRNFTFEHQLRKLIIAYSHKNILQYTCEIHAIWVEVANLREKKKRLEAQVEKGRIKLQVERDIHHRHHSK